MTIYRGGRGDACGESCGLNTAFCVDGFVTRVPILMRKFRGEIFYRLKLPDLAPILAEGSVSGFLGKSGADRTLEVTGITAENTVKFIF